MSVPQPKNPLQGHCSVIDQETLYVLSPDGLQSLPLKANATWSEEASGVSVTGAACVRAVPNGDESYAALYVVGGTSDDHTYNGLQRYFFANKTWETLPLQVDIMQDRTNHSAVFLNDTQSILVYAGSQPQAPSFLSSQTFVISTKNYLIDSFTSQAHPANQPILQPWNSSHAVMAGGSPLSNTISTFSPSSGWEQFGTSLSTPLASGLRGTIVDGSDGSRVLEVYDMTQAPNVVNQIVLLDANGQPAPSGQTIGGQIPSRKVKRDLTLQNWPAYNSTNAPTTTRSDYSVAPGSNGRAVIAGGSTDDPVSIFDQSSNEWVDAAQFFHSKNHQQPLLPSSTQASSTSATPTSSPTKSAKPKHDAGGNGHAAHNRTMRTLGITLGVLFGIAALFILILLFMRWRKMKARKNAKYVNEEDTGRNNRMSFADRGASFMKEAGVSGSELNYPEKDRYNPEMAGSRSSLAIVAGKFGGNKRNTASHAPKGSYESTTRLVRDKKGNLPMEMMDIGEKSMPPLPPVNRKPVPQHQPPSVAVYPAVSPQEEPLEEPKRGSGWSQYFAASGPGVPSAYYGKEHLSTGDASEYSRRTTQLSRIPSSVLVPPLDIDFSKTVDGQRLSHVATGSPAFANSAEDLARQGNTAAGQTGLIEEAHNRPVSNTNTVSSYDRSTISSTDYYNMSSANTNWTPTSNSNNFMQHDNHSRAASSNYTTSIYEQRVPSRGARAQQGSGFFPGAGTMYKPASRAKLGNAAPNPPTDWAATATKASSPDNATAGGGFRPPPPVFAHPDQGRDSTATVFPREEGDHWTANANRYTNDDMGDPKPPTAPGMTALPKYDRDSTATIFPHEDGGHWTANARKYTTGGADDYDDLKPPNAPGMAALPSHDRDSTATVFPRGVPSAYYANRPKELEDHQGKQPMSSDMSWLNLGHR